MIGIYKITSPTNKVYIGQSINLNNRFQSYKRLECKQQPQIFNSLNKHGFNNHIIEILEECSLELLNERENFYKTQFVNKYGWSKALFCDLFDNGVGPRSKQTKQNISQGRMGKNGWPKGQSQSEETKQKKRLANQGKPKPEGFGDVISQLKKGKSIINNFKPIICTNTGKIFNSITECSKEMNINKSTISQVLKGNYKKTKHGYIFKYIINE
jgi:group I intron endonuclease